MPLVPYGSFDPFRLLDRWKKEMGQWWEKDLPKFFPEEAGGPFKLEMRETDKEVAVYCRASGLKKESDIQVQVDGRLLTVWRNVDASYEMKGPKQYKREQYAGHFQQSVLLPSPVIPEMGTKKFINGMIEIRWPKVKGC